MGSGGDLGADYPLSSITPPLINHSITYLINYLINYLISDLIKDSLMRVPLHFWGALMGSGSDLGG